MEAANGAGLPRTVLVGLPDAPLNEARDRCRAAVAGAGLSWPSQLLTINLTPASLPKAGSHYDLAIVAAVLAAAGTVPRSIASASVLVGEVGLDGRVRQVRGVLPALLAAREAGIGTAIVPAPQIREAQLVSGITIWGVACLDDLIEVLHGLVEHYAAHPGLLPPDHADLAEQDAVRAAVTYVGGMTDRFAFDTAEHLLGWDPDRLPQGIGRVG